MSSTPSSRQEFIKSVTKTLNSYGFNGLDMDWEYPSNPGEKHNYTLLMQELRRSFDKEKPRLLLSAAVSAGFEKIETGYDVPALSRSVDFFNLMTYDLHGPWDKRTGHNTPLYSHPLDTPYSKKLTVSNAASTWVHKGAPKDKIMVGMATYGRTFTLANPASWGVNAVAVSGGNPGPYTRKAGCLAYYEICQMLKDGAHYEWDKNMHVPYAVKGDQWIGYDNESSIRQKTAWLRKNGYGGAMVWTMDFDDFKGNYSDTNFPLIKTIKSELQIVDK
uniref:GH18 domain-containing protein n=1 Tax=Cuerna arida TaxID=1464854 RepID=A0A1B6GBR1_9HEMI